MILIFRSMTFEDSHFSSIILFGMVNLDLDLFMPCIYDGKQNCI